MSAFQEVFGNITVPGCSVPLRTGLYEACDEDVGSVAHCLVSLPLLPPPEIADAVSDI